MTVRTSKHRRRAVMAAALAIVTGASVAASGPASATPSAASTTTSGADRATASSAAPPAGGTTAALNLPDKPTVVGPKTVQPVASNTCPTSGAPLQRNAAEHGKPAICLTADPIAAPASAQTAAGSVTPNAVVGRNCVNQTNAWRVDRTTACIKSFGITAEVHYPNGPIIGTQHFLLNQSIALNTNGSGITENDTITRDGGSGEFATSWIIAHFTSFCSSQCLTNNPANAISLPDIGSTADFALTYSDSPALGQKDTFDILYGLSVDFLSELPASDVLRWSLPESIRCDNMLAPRSPGCVFPFFGPILTLPLSVYGAAAFNVAVGQKDLDRPFGTQAAPLTRGDPRDTDPNRTAVCDNTFSPSLLLVPNDSCDEFPFASSQQSGAQRGFTGLACMEIVPQQKSNGVWKAWVWHGNTGVHPCLRGHVNLTQNRAVGTAVGQMYSTYRLITGDQYGVEVVN